MSYFNSDLRSGGRKSFGGGRSRSFGDDRRQDRQMHPAVCAACGRDCQVPFFPDGSKPIYCSDCFEKNQDNYGGQGRSNYGNDRQSDRPRQFESRRGDRDQNQNKTYDILNSINAKLEKIIYLLSIGKPSFAQNSPVQKPKKSKSKKTEKVEIVPEVPEIQEVQSET